MPDIPLALPASMTSTGAALGARGRIEVDYQALTEQEMRGFLGDVEREAAQAARRGSTLDTLVVLGLWAALLSRTGAALPSLSYLQLSLKDTELPRAVASAVQREQGWAQGAGVSDAHALARLRTVLGISATPVEGMGGAFGRLLVNIDNATGNGAGQWSWTGQSEAWARTAATADFASEMIEQLRSEGFTHKRWHTRYDSKVRDTHVSADTTTLLLDDLFTVGGVALRYPGDPMAVSVGETINCRCVITGVRYGQRALDHPAGTEPWNNPRPR